jgi:two-component system CheB/CheR fusion protein
MMRRRYGRYAFGLLALTAVYFTTARLGLSLAAPAAQVTLVWPPTGIALCAILLFGNRVWPGIALGAFLVNATVDEPLLVAAGIGAGNTLEALLAAWVLRHVVDFRPALDRLRDVLGLVVWAAGVSTLVGASVGVTCLCLGGVQAWDDYLSLFSIWWLGDAMGDLVMAPALLAWASGSGPRWDARRVAEAAVLLTGLALVSTVAFTGGAGRVAPVEYAVFPFVIWAAMRFGPAGSATATLTTVAIAVWGTETGTGPFVRATASESLVLAQIYLAVVAVTGLVLSAAVAEQTGQSARRRRAERALREGEERYRWLVENTNEAIWRFDLKIPLAVDRPEGEQIDHIYRHAYLAECNDQMAQMYGYTAAAEMVGQRLDDLMPPTEPHNVAMLRAFLRAGCRLVDAESVEVDRHGRPKHFINSFIGRVEGGRLCWAWGASRDVTERRRAADALRESEERLRLALDAGRIGAWDWDIPTNRITWSERLYEFHGLVPGTFGGRVEDFAGLVHPDDATRVQAAIQGAVHDRAPYGIEFRIVRPGGEVRWIATSGRVLYDADGRPVRMLGAAIDVTERRAAEEALREADRRKDELLAMLAHELRNPLAPIRNALAVLKAGGADGEAVRDILERQVRHLARLVDDLLDVSRVLRGKIDLRKEPLELAAVVACAVETAQPAIAEFGHRLSIDLPPAPVRFVGDPVRLAQVLANLLNNAAKYTDPMGRIALTATMVVPEDGNGSGTETSGPAADAEPGELVIRVRDTGIGISAALLPRVFDLFEQADRSLGRSQGGLGIGLTLVKRLVELHGGRVEAHSAGTGRGSEFVVRLPLPVQAANAPPASAVVNGARAAPRRRVLVVDDNRDAAESLAALLRIQGHDVRVAGDGPKALASAEEDPPEVVFLDLGMPGMDGYEVARRMREGPTLRQAILVALTGWGQDEDRRRTRAAGFDHHLVKPADPEALEGLLAGPAPA